jgi:hypothetical protein
MSQPHQSEEATMKTVGGETASGGDLTSAHLTAESLAASWKHVSSDGEPPVDGETVFVGINSAGYSACFNEITDPGDMCAMVTAESCVFLMSELRWWRVLDRPMKDSPPSGE